MMALVAGGPHVMEGRRALEKSHIADSNRERHSFERSPTLYDVGSSGNECHHRIEFVRETVLSELILCLKQNHKSCDFFFRSRLDEPMNLKKVEGTRNYRRKYRIMDVLKVEPRSQNEVMIAV
jgi:hypothetical protein